MATQRDQILPLSLEVQSQIKSSIAITSLSNVVIELIKNALDAQARAVYVQIDYLRGGCCVEDDGNGMPASELSEHGHLGSMYCTSKHNLATDTYGSHGRFISSLSTLSLLSITSRHRAEADECTISFHEAQVIARFRTTQERQRVLHKIHGTRVIVRDLFGKLPVRVKHRAIQYGFQGNLDKEFEDFKRNVVSLLLAWSRPIKIVLSDTEKRKKCVLRLDRESSSSAGVDAEIDAKLPFRLDRICGLLAQAGYIVQSSFASWVTASARTSTTSIRAAISLEPAPTKQVQFISLGIRPVISVHGNQVLFDEVNRLFALSSFGAIEDDIKIFEDENSRRQIDDYTTRQARGIAKGPDRWPMFYIRIDSSSNHRIPDDSQAHDLGGEVIRVLNKVLQLLKTLIYQFLEEHHFRPRVRRQNRGTENSKIDGMRNPFSDPLERIESNEGSSESAHTTTSMTGPSPQPNALKLLRHVTGQGLDSWSRVKSGKRDGFEHIVSGLPRSKSLQGNPRPVAVPAASNHRNDSMLNVRLVTLADTKSQPSLGDDVQMLLQDLQNEDAGSDSEDEEVSNGVRPSIVSTSDDQTMEEEDTLPHDNRPTNETTLWTNPTTGRVVHINSRTGLIVPNIRAQCADNGADDDERSAESFGDAAFVSGIGSARSVRTARQTMKPGLHVAPESWIGELLRGSENSIFRQPEAAIPSVTPEAAFRHSEGSSCCRSRSGTRSLKQHSALFDVMTAVTRLSKGGLDDAQVLAQIDRKFILVKITTSQTHAQTDSPDGVQPPEETLVVLVDQHAADERCQVEALYAELCKVETVQLLKPMYFEVSETEVRLFELQKDFFAGWGFCFETHIGHAHCAAQFAYLRTRKRPSSAQSRGRFRIVVKTLPSLIAERCRLDPNILIDLLRSEVWAGAENRCAKSRAGVSSKESEIRRPDLKVPGGDDKRWLTMISTCPKGLIDMLNSRACRSAIMFNDILSIEECKMLVKRLAKCSFPFQCAHGRPSMVVLGGLEVVDAGDGWLLGTRPVPDDAECGGDFARAFGKWQATVGKASIRD